MSDEVKPPRAETAKSVDLKTPDEWAKITGNAQQSTPGVEWVGTLAESGMSGAKFAMAHEIASVLHGWPSHAHHANEPIKLSREDYEAALKAAFPQEGNPKPHRGALSKHHPAFKTLTEKA
jgi:hypothetical protein